MDQIYNKINNHEYLNDDDIVKIIEIETDGKVNTVFLESEDFGKSFCQSNNTINIGKKDNFILKKFMIESRRLKLKVKNPNNPSTFLVDLYNLYLFYEILHEIEHSKQIEMINKLNDAQSELLKISSNHVDANPNMYDNYHDLYYIEYHAVINPFIKILDLLDTKLVNLDKRSIIDFNRQIAGTIYHSYGYKITCKDPKIYNKFCSPICYTKFLSKIYSTSDERKIMKICIEDLKKNSKTEYQKIVNGLPLSDNTLKYMHNVYFGDEKTSNLIEDIKKGKQKIK